ncbi:MAG: hypothetical protein SVK54_03585, partial [candidate division WOR-3 bacterium]|nr:hypothetical protein [candidate division WOR-3 bacterium]
IEKMGEDMTDTDMINLRTYLAFAQVALGNTKAAQENFEKILTINRNYSLNEEFVSPKIIDVFKQAKNRVNLFITDQPDYYKYSSPMTRVPFSQTNLLVKSIVVPGWGQIDKNHTVKGILTGSVFMAGAVSAIVSFIAMDNARDRYLNAASPETARQLYNTYNNYSILNRISFDIMLSAYVFNILDVLWVD